MRIYTDGSCTSAGDGGWAWATSPEGERRDSGPSLETTNQRMEMMAALQALISNRTANLTIVSDSRYVVDCFNKKWYVKWLKNGWKNSSHEDVANRDLWEALLEAVEGRSVTFEWVKGHSTDPMNALVDRLASAARTGTPVKETTDVFEIACNAMLRWWKSDRTPSPEVVEQVEAFLVKMKLIEG